jgi:23S rRNA (uracil1939-C5)-methyltransferase
MVVLVVGESIKERVEFMTRVLCENFPQVISVYSCVNTKVNDAIHDLHVQLESGNEYIRERLEHVEFNIGPKSFFQTNSMQALTLYSLARKLARLSPTDHLYDLYCGVGSLGIFMADQCRKVVGIEQIPEAIMDARENAILNRCSNVFFETGRVELLLDTAFIREHGAPDVIITDPPRAGMHPDAVACLNASGADRIVYVSCNPATQARDIKMLSPAYTLISAVPVDMFPHTHHIECVALLKRS